MTLREPFGNELYEIVINARLSINRNAVYIMTPRRVCHYYHHTCDKQIQVKLINFNTGIHYLLPLRISKIVQHW
jgi:hypothetical protein